MKCVRCFELANHPNHMRVTPDGIAPCDFRVPMGHPEGRFTAGRDGERFVIIDHELNRVADYGAPNRYSSEADLTVWTHDAVRDINSGLEEMESFYWEEFDIAV